jgi:hypothetical protein
MPGNSNLITMKSLLDALRIPARDGQSQSQSCLWANNLSDEAHERRREAYSELRNALASLPGRINPFDFADPETPKCVDSGILCESHYELYQQLMHGHGKDVLDDESAQPISPKAPKAKHEVASSTPRDSAGHGNVLRDSIIQGYRYRDVWAESGRSPSDFERGLVEEDDDDEEVTSKDDVSKTRKRLLVVHDNGIRTLTQISGDSLMQHGTTSGNTEKYPNTGPARSGDFDRATAVEHRTENGLLTPENGSIRRQSTPHSTPRMIAVRLPMERSYSPRARKALAHLKADESYEKPVANNEKSVREVIGKTSNLDSAKGFVYALRDKEFELVKIGCTQHPVAVRGKNIKRDCNMFDHLVFIYQVEVVAYKKLEKIIQRDLQPHRWFVACNCRTNNLKGYTRHQEYFAIDDNTAIRTLQFWSEFFKKQQPWGDLSSGADARLTETWVTKLATTPTFDVSETHDRHELREKRWREFLDIPIVQVNEFDDVTIESVVRTRSREFGTAAAFSTDLPCETTPSKPPRFLIGQSADEIVRAETQTPPCANLGTSSSGPDSESMESYCGMNAQLSLHTKDSAIGLTARLRAAKTSDQEEMHTDSWSGQSSQPAEEKSAPTHSRMGAHTNDAVTTAHFDDVQPSQRRYIHESGRVADTLALKSALALTATRLTDQVKARPEKTIFADLWKLRWPLVCCVLFVVYSPYLPSGLTYLMWSLFLPLFVAELRGWTNTAESERSYRGPVKEFWTRA